MVGDSTTRGSSSSNNGRRGSDFLLWRHDLAGARPVALVFRTAFHRWMHAQCCLFFVVNDLGFLRSSIHAVADIEPSTLQLAIILRFPRLPFATVRSRAMRTQNRRPHRNRILWTHALTIAWMTPLEQNSQPFARARQSELILAQHEPGKRQKTQVRSMLLPPLAMVNPAFPVSVPPREGRLAAQHCDLAASRERQSSRKRDFDRVVRRDIVPALSMSAPLPVPASPPFIVRPSSMTLARVYANGLMRPCSHPGWRNTDIAHSRGRLHNSAACLEAPNRSPGAELPGSPR